MLECACCNCGLLAVRDGQSNVVVATELTRTHGQHSPGFAGIICAAGVADLEDDLQKFGPPDMPGKTKTKLFLEVPRKCDRFFPWERGASLREHREMMRMELLEKMRDEQRERDKESQSAQKREDRLFQTELKKIELEFQEDQKRKDRKVQAILAVAAAIFGILSTIILIKLGFKP